MGCFDYTCTVSNLPIGAGTPVRFMLFVQAKYDDFQGYTTSNLNLLCPPIVAEYNDYGTIENYNPKGVDVRMFLDLMKVRAVEIPTGENKYHDSAVIADADMESWLDVIRQDRVKVTEADKDTSWRDEWEERQNANKEIPGKEGAPTWRRIQKQLEAKGLPIGPDAYSADDIFYGCVRVRHHEYGTTKDKMIIARDALGDEYGTIFVPGSGASHWDTEMLVFPHTNDRFLGKKKEDVGESNSVHYDMIGGVRVGKQSEFNVYQGMIREDVWQYLLNLEIENWRTKEQPYTAKYFYDEAKKFWDESKAHQAKQDPAYLATLSEEDRRTILREMMFFNMNERDNLVYAIIKELQNGPWLKYVWDIAVQTLTSDEDIESFIRYMSECIKVQFTLPLVRYMYHRGNTVGEQHGGNLEHVKYHTFLAELAQKEYKSRETYDEEEEKPKPKKTKTKKTVQKKSAKKKPKAKTKA